MWFVENYQNKSSIGIKIKKEIISEQTPFQKLDIYETESFGKLLVLDDCVMVCERDEFVYHEMITHMPLCAHPNPKKALVIGGGDGGSVREILKHPSIEEVVLCEIDKRVVELCQEHMPQVAHQLINPKVKLAFEDGFEFLPNYKNYFDFIITDSTDPVGPGAALFTQKYYQLVKESLHEDGIMTCQSESPWFFADALTNLTKNICETFLHVETYIAMIPFYPSGFWTMTFASDKYSLKNFNKEKSAAISKSCRYYNPQIHLGALALPNFAKSIIHNK